MLNIGQNCTKGGRIALRLIGRDSLGRDAGLIHGTSEEAFCSVGIASFRKEVVDDLAILINGAIDIGPLPVQPCVRLINAPVFADWASMNMGSFAKQRKEALDPTVDGAAVNHDTSLGKPLDHVGIAQPVPDVPAHGQGDHVIWEGMVRESTG